MPTLVALYLQNPFWVWLGIGAIFVILQLAIGSGRLIWPALAAALVAFIDLAGVRVGPVVEAAIFAVMAIAGVALSILIGRRKPSASAAVTAPAPQPASVQEDAPLVQQDRTGRLVGRIGRTVGTFVNGVGRVWIDGTEWGAEIEGLDDVPSDSPVRVLGVSGGVRLRVQGLTTR